MWFERGFTLFSGTWLKHCLSARFVCKQAWHILTTSEVCGIKHAAVRWSRVAYAAGGANYHPWLPSDRYSRRLRSVIIYLLPFYPLPTCKAKTWLNKIDIPWLYPCFSKMWNSKCIYLFQNSSHMQKTQIMTSKNNTLSTCILRNIR